MNSSMRSSVGHGRCISNIYIEAIGEMHIIQPEGRIVDLRLSASDDA